MWIFRFTRLAAPLIYLKPNDNVNDNVNAALSYENKTLRYEDETLTLTLTKTKRER